MDLTNFYLRLDDLTNGQCATMIEDIISGNQNELLDCLEKDSKETLGINFYLETYMESVRVLKTALDRLGLKNDSTIKAHLINLELNAKLAYCYL